MTTPADYQRKMIESERKWWRELKALEGDVPGFYSHYAKYLEAKGIVSRERSLLYRMAVLPSNIKKPG